jgi:CDP-glucose 4,6-dehydratase
MDLIKSPRLHALSGPILITGHSGFKGTWLTLLLERLGIEVVGYSLPPEKNSLFYRGNRIGKIQEEFADIRDYQQLNSFIQNVKPSAIIHMAAQPLVLESYRIPKDTFDINVMGTVNILNSAFANESVKSVIAVTTDKVYRNNNSGIPFTESGPLEGKDPYSASKVGAEATIAAWQQIAKISGGPKVVSVRAGNVIGGGDWAAERLLPDLIRSFINQEKIFLRNPESTRPWQHVLDPICGYLSALEFALEGESNPAFNFGPDSPSISVGEVVEIAIKYWPKDSLSEIPAKNQKNHLEAFSLNLDASSAHKILGWQPFWTQESAVIATINWWNKVINQDVSPITACHDDIIELLGESHL